MNKANECTCPSGDGSLVHPCPAHPAVEQAGGDEREAAIAKFAETCHMTAESAAGGNSYDIELRRYYLLGWDDRTALAQPSPASDLDPFNLAPHAEAFNEAPDEALKPDQAEAERPEVVAWQYRVTAGPQTGWSLWHPGKGEEFERSYTVERRPLMTVAQHERIVGELRAVIAQLRQHKNDYMDSGQETYRALQNEIREREAEIARLDGLVSGRTAERDAALARVAELEKQEPVATVAKVPGEDWNGLHFYRDLQGMQPGTKLYAAPVAQAQHSVPDELRAICMLVAETGIKYGRGRHRAVAADECRAVVNAVLDADLSVGRACEYAGCCDKAHPGTSLCIAHHSKKAQEKLLAAAPGKEGV
ncbi:hypothetical protein VXI23_005838 [Pseudomonas aeruginosa]|nr:hypothetical protein [Pseudomonas aeruginosa]